MENKKPSIEEIFKNGVTVDYELYKSDLKNLIKKENETYGNANNYQCCDVSYTYKYMSDKVDEFISINDNVSDKYLRIFFNNIYDNTIKNILKDGDIIIDNIYRDNVFSKTLSLAIRDRRKNIYICK